MLENDRNLKLVVLVISALVAVLVTADLLADFRAGAGADHLALEALLLLAAISGVAVLLVNLYQQRRTSERLRIRLHSVDEQVARFRSENRDLLHGISDAIDRQFGSWGLTAAEAEVGRLLLKGLPFKLIAEVRECSERTVRAQARAIYRKADLTGRTELSAFFLEDLFVGGLGDETDGESR